MNVAACVAAGDCALVGYWRFDDNLGIDSHSVEDFTARQANIDTLPDWFFGWPHAAYPSGGAGITDEEPPVDNDEDGLADWWEMANFHDLDELPDGDPDEDQLTNSRVRYRRRRPVRGRHRYRP